ncbi:unnamed protein product [Linum trigynum]|uniref:Uncharacterized protein n=1 Tax=Linum trigynum TaxID=586398 RepID=A0AAV2ESH5_9ROSI
MANDDDSAGDEMMAGPGASGGGRRRRRRTSRRLGKAGRPSAGREVKEASVEPSRVRRASRKVGCRLCRETTTFVVDGRWPLGHVDGRGGWRRQGGVWCVTVCRVTRGPRQLGLRCFRRRPNDIV